MTIRHRVLPKHGAALVSTDIHGNYDDFLALQRVFESLGDDAHWLILGDVVHGPDDDAREHKPELYGYLDRSDRIVADLIELERAHQGRVHFVIGNHDHGHVGGPHTSKFWRDEVAHLEEALSADERTAMRSFFSRGLVAVAAPCGVFFSHGSPNDNLERLEHLDRIDDFHALGDPYLTGVLRSFLTHYGQSDAMSARFLARISQNSALDLRVVVHGHDRIETGFYHEGEHQACLCIFGAPREAKRYLVLDLAARYERASDLRDGLEIRRLYLE